MADESKAASWRELLEKTVELGLGAALLTKDAAVKLVEDLVKRGALTRDEASKLVSEMMTKGAGQKERMEAFVGDVVERMLARADLARRSRVEELEERLAALEEEAGRKHGD